MQPAHRAADLLRLVLGAGEGVEAAVGIRLEQIGPALEALGPPQDPRRGVLGMDCSDTLQLVQGLMLHGSAPDQDAVRSAPAGPFALTMKLKPLCGEDGMADAAPVPFREAAIRGTKPAASGRWFPRSRT